MAKRRTKAGPPARLSPAREALALLRRAGDFAPFERGVRRDPALREAFLWEAGSRLRRMQRRGGLRETLPEFEKRELLLYRVLVLEVHAQRKERSDAGRQAGD